MTIRISAILWMVLLVIGAFGLYMVKYKVQTIKHEVITTQNQLAQEKRNLHVLEAEWAFLNRPERLKALTEKYLDIKPVRGQQIAEFSSLPYAGVANVAAAETNTGPTLARYVTGAPPRDHVDSDNDQ